MNSLVGLIGKKRSGKDTFAVTLTEHRGFERFAFADPLKAAVYSVNPIVCDGGLVKRLRDVVDRHGWEEAKENREVRRLLQEYGVSIREIQPGFWVDATMRPALDALGTSRVVVTDVRFPNEVEAIKVAGGSIVRITRPGLVSDDQHVSETALDDYVADHTVVNDGTLIDLAVQALILDV